MASKPAEAFTALEALITKSGTRKKKSGLKLSPSTEYLTLFIYITAFEVTSAPEPAVVGMAASFANFFLIS